MRRQFKNIADSLVMMWKLDRIVPISAVLIALIDAVMPFISILLSAFILDGLTLKKEWSSLLVTSLITVFSLFALTVFKAWLQKLNTIHAGLCGRRFDMEMNQRTLTMDYELLDSPLVNEIRERIRNDNSWGAGFYSMIWMLPWLVRSILGLLLSLIILFPLIMTDALSMDPATIGLLILFFLILLLSSLYNAGNRKKFIAHLNASDQGNSFYGAFVWKNWDYKTGKDIRIYNMKPLIEHYFNQDPSYDRYVYHSVRLDAGNGFAGGLSSGLLLTLSYLFVVLKAITGVLSIGSVLKYAAAIYQFATQLSSVISAYNEYSVAAGRQQSTMDYMKIQDVLYKGSLPVEKRSDNDYLIEFQNVTFRYPGSDQDALRNFNLKLQIGKKLAVVGRNGSGKTTMIKLLCRLYDPTEGQITLNGIDIRKYDYEEYQRIFSVVFQDFKLLSFSLGQNVAAGIDVREDEALAALQKAGLSRRMQSMPQGLNTPLYYDFEEDGVEISGGEAQKIALARALYKDAPFIVLDEPTAALDPIAEYEIYSKFNTIVGEKTAIYISHRLSSCRFCDDIAVFHDGALVQRGNHDSLIADENGEYYGLWNAQAQYYKQGEAGC